MFLRNQFLIAMPSLIDSCFTQSLVYICAHGSQGALALIINRAMPFPVGHILQQLQIETMDEVFLDQPLLYGGPVHRERGFILHRESDKKWENSMALDSGLVLTTSRDVVQAIAQGEGPKDALFALGCAGWGSGQLEDEISKNAWLNCPMNEDIMFHVPLAERWKAAGALLGVDMNHLSGDAGHA